MAIPTTRDGFKQLCLRQLGAPVIDINVSEEQVDDCVDLALRYWQDYHMDGTDKQYYKYKITSQDIINKYITIPENIIGVINLFPIGDALNTANMFSIRYQIALNDLYTLTNVSLVPYYMALTHVRLIEEILVGKQMLRYNRHMNRCYIDMDWTKLQTDYYLILECYGVVDPDTYPDVWKDWWITRYTTALIKKQWGNNLKKFTGMMLPGGVQFSGQQIYDEAVQEIQDLEANMINSFSLPVADLIG
jgi:hypothetical protein